MNWLTILLTLTPYVIAGIGQIAANKGGKDKKQLALDALNIATAGAEAVDPNDAAITQAASTVTGLVIDSTINDRKAAVIDHVIEHHVTQLKASGVLPSTPRSSLPAADTLASGPDTTENQS